jgi:bile acid:Na+ symporter, BASS family
MVLQIALGIVMLGLGLGLTLADFRRVFAYPRAVIVGLTCQMLILPLACVAIAHLFALPPELAVGLMLLAASPGGATANLFSHLARGDVALNVTLTAVNSVLALLTLPLIVKLSLSHFMGSASEVPMPLEKVVQTFAIVLTPIAIGMLVKARRPGLALKLDKPVRIVSALLLALVIVGSVLKERANIAEYFRQVGLAALAFNLVSLATGYFVPRLAKVPEKQAVAIGMEIGIHNGTLAIAVANTVLASSVMAIPPSIYSLIMFFTAGAFGTWVSKRTKVDAEAPPATT